MPRLRSYDKPIVLNIESQALYFLNLALLQMARDLETFYREGRLSDFTIVVGNREMRAHRAILSARSPVFAAMLEPHTEEFKNNKVVLEDVEFEVKIFIEY